MTISTQNNTYSYTGNGVTTAYSFPRLFYDNSHLVVKVNDVTQTITTDYTVTGAGSGSGGTVTFLSAPANGASVVIQRVVPYTQETDFENYDGNPADVTEKAFDLLAMADQQLAESVGRSILAPVTTTLTSNVISGTIDSTTRILTITTAGPAASTLATLGDEIDTILTGTSSGDLLQWNGSAWVNKDVGEIIDGLSSVSAAVLDTLPIKDVSDTNAPKEVTVQSVIDLVANDLQGKTDTVITASDKITFYDVSDSNLPKTDTVQGVLDLVPGYQNNGYRSSYYYSGFGYRSTSATKTVAANRLYVRPFIVGKTTTFTRIGIEVTTGSAGNCRLGLYTWADGLPTTVLYDFGTVSTATTGIKEVTISQSISAGVYGIACIFDATPAVYAIEPNDEIKGHYLGETLPGANLVSGVYDDVTYGALGTFVWTANIINGADVPGVFMRVV